MDCEPYPTIIQTKQKGNLPNSAAKLSRAILKPKVVYFPPNNESIGFKQT